MRLALAALLVTIAWNAGAQTAATSESGGRGTSGRATGGTSTSNPGGGGSGAGILQGSGFAPAAPAFYGNGGGGDERSQAVISFVLAVCASTSSDVFSGDCTNSSGGEAVGRLGNAFIDAYQRRLISNAYKIYFPQLHPKVEQLKFIKDLELRAVRMAESAIKAQLQFLTPFHVEDGAERRSKQEALNEEYGRLRRWSAEATANAEAGTNWEQESMTVFSFKGRINRPMSKPTDLLQSSPDGNRRDRTGGSWMGR